MAFLSLHPAALSKPYLPLLVEDGNPCAQWIVDRHRRVEQAPVHALGCYVLNGLVVTGRGNLYHEGQPLTSVDLLPTYRKNLLDQQKSALAAELCLPEKIVEEPCIVFMGHGCWVYGHVLLEMMLRLQLAFDSGFGRFKLLFNTESAPWVLPLVLRAFRIGQEAVIQYQPIEGAREAGDCNSPHDADAWRPLSSGHARHRRRD
jgi:hypothetical protein